MKDGKIFASLVTLRLWATFTPKPQNIFRQTPLQSLTDREEKKGLASAVHLTSHSLEARAQLLDELGVLVSRLGAADRLSLLDLAFFFLPARLRLSFFWCWGFPLSFLGSELFFFYPTLRSLFFFFVGPFLADIALCKMLVKRILMNGMHQVCSFGLCGARFLKAILGSG